MFCNISYAVALGYYAVKTNDGNCASSSNWLNYILRNDYTEIGFIQTSRVDGGHVFNYIKQGEWYYFIDLTKYTKDVVRTAIESGDMSDYKNSDYINGNVHKTKSIQSYVDYILRDYHEPPALMLIYTASDSLAVGTRGTMDNRTLYFEKRDGVEINVIYYNQNTTLKYELTSFPTIKADWNAK